MVGDIAGHAILSLDAKRQADIPGCGMLFVPNIDYMEAQDLCVDVIFTFSDVKVLPFSWRSPMHMGIKGAEYLNRHIVAEVIGPETDFSEHAANCCFWDYGTGLLKKSEGRKQPQM